MSANSFTWRCPYCNHNATITDENFSVSSATFNHNNKDGDLISQRFVTVCPNKACREYSIEMTIQKVTKYNSTSYDLIGKPIATWRLRPQSSAKPQPAYIPAPIRADYEEACAILDLSPKASATLSRRCLQGMIRNFWGISKPRLVDEIDALKDKVDGDTWDALDALRKLGNIGAHMEKDISVIVDVDPDEASLLVNLLEGLLEDWYVQRHNRQKNMQMIVATAKSKEAQKKITNAVQTS